jgi:hypothetical protein
MGGVDSIANELREEVFHGVAMEDLEATQRVMATLKARLGGPGKPLTPDDEPA